MATTRFDAETLRGLALYLAEAGLMLRTARQTAELLAGGGPGVGAIVVLEQAATGLVRETLAALAHCTPGDDPEARQIAEETLQGIKDGSLPAIRPCVLCGSAKEGLRPVPSRERE